MAPPADRLQGTLDLLILRVLATDPMHGWGIAQRLRALSDDLFQVNQGSLYPCLHRLEDQDWISASWGTTENNRRARYYTLTPSGKKRLTAESQEFNRMMGAIRQVMESA